jgi:hypothetical protein
MFRCIYIHTPGNSGSPLVRLNAIEPRYTSSRAKTMFHEPDIHALTHNFPQCSSLPLHISDPSCSTCSHYLPHRPTIPVLKNENLLQYSIDERIEPLLPPISITSLLIGGPSAPTAHPSTTHFYKHEAVKDMYTISPFTELPSL